MFGFGFSEMIIIFVLGIIVIGPERLPDVFRFLGRQYGKLMRASQDLRRAFMMEAERAEAEYRAKELKIRREEAKKRLAEQLKKAESGESVPVSSGANTYIPFDIDPENDPHLNSDDPLPLPPEEASTAASVSSENDTEIEKDPSESTKVSNEVLTENENAPSTSSQDDENEE